VTLVML